MMKIWRSAYRGGSGVKKAAAGGGRKVKRGLAAVLAGLVLAVAACGTLPPLPAHFQAESYTPITYQELMASRAATLQAGQKVKVPAYFWQSLDYDPAMLRNYMDMLRYPLKWYKLEWFATYGNSDMQDYYDRVALDSSTVRTFKPRRLDHIMIYGELASLGPGLYLRVHRIERIEED